MEFLLTLQVRILLDIKNPHVLAVPTLQRLFQSYPDLYQRAAVCSFFPQVNSIIYDDDECEERNLQVPYELRRLDPRVIVAHTWRPGFYSFHDTMNEEPRFPDSVLKQAAAVVIDFLNVWATHHIYWRLR